MSTPTTPILETVWESPSINDVLAVKEALFQASGMPTELIDAIIDHAEYWPHTSVDTTPYGAEKLQSLTARGDGGPLENLFIIRSLPVGVLPEQLDSHTHLGIADTFASNSLKSMRYPEQSDSAKSATQELIQKWSLNNYVRGKNPCRKIVFTIWSHDQGWGGHPRHKGTFQGSYTWFEVGLERIVASDPSSSNEGYQFPVTTDIFLAEEFTHKIPCVLQPVIPEVKEEGSAYQLEPQDNCLIRNRTAHKVLQKHVITWSATDNVTPDDPWASKLKNEGRGKASGNGEFVRNLKVGDVITLWSKARFRGWVNNLEYCKIDVYWSV